MTQYGVRITGIRYRGNETDFPDGTYLIMLNEVPVVSGNISLNERFYPGDPSELKKLGINGTEAINPLTRETGCWVNDTDIGKLNGEKEYLWQVMEYPIHHLESVLQDNLVEFLGHQEVMNTLFEKYPEKQEDYAENKDKLTRLTTLLRGLASEKVAITEFKMIVDFMENHPDVENLTELINKIRRLREVNKSLPGNKIKIPFLKLSNEMEVEIQKSLYQEDGKYVLAIKPETCQQVLSAVRNKVVKGPIKGIIVENDQLRPLVNQLLKLEFPDCPVLSQNEVNPAHRSGPKDYIEL